MAKKKNDNPQEAIDALIGNAPTVKKIKGKAKAEKQEIEFNEEFHSLVCLKIVKDYLKGAEESLTNQFKEQAFEVFHEEVKVTGKQPATFVAVHKDATGSFQYRQTGHGFDPEVAEELIAKGIPVDVEVKEGGDIILNPEVLANKDLLGRLAVAIQKMPEFAGIQVFQKTEETKKYKFNDATFEGIIKNFEDSDQKRLLEAIGTLAFATPKLEGVGNKDQSIVTKALSNLANANILKWNNDKKVS